MNEEQSRLSGTPHELASWRRWGPYLSERAWGTVREDYSANGDAWSYLPHDLARSKAYRWGEDGIAGICDRYQILCWSLALWNEADPILKERFFGLVPSEGNHGEDVKECYFYVDGLPSHAYQRMLYKYPQRAFPYGQLIDQNHGGADRPEFELIDTGTFDDNRYFDVEIEIAKEDAETLLFRITAHNRAAVGATLHLIPQLWFRNTWSWSAQPLPAPVIRDVILDGGRRALLADDRGTPAIAGLAAQPHLGPHLLELPDGATPLFTDNETNGPRVFGAGATSRSRYLKDAFHRRIVNGEHDAVNPAATGTKACAWQRVEIEPGGSHVMRMRLRCADSDADEHGAALDDAAIDELFARRRAEADAFYTGIHPKRASAEERNVQRQAFAGMLWNKQSYLYDVDVWLDGDNATAPPPEERQHGRNHRWRHLNSMRILSMPDAWEYPWFAAWDLAFHSVVFALIDAHFAKEQLWLMLFEQFQHPNGQIPAYEWEFSDLNPPVHAWAVWRVYNMDHVRSGVRDRAFLEKCFHKLLLNFTWWVNKVDHEGNNVFEGGFLGLDNITLFDRSDTLGDGAVLEQSDATGWMGMFSLVMMRVALELAIENKAYEGLATKFFEHYVYIGAAMKKMRGGETLWDERDGFFYDLLRFPDGSAMPFRVRSMVGLIPMYAIERLELKWLEPFPVFRENLEWFREHRRDVVERCVSIAGTDDDITLVLAVVDRPQLHRLLERIVDPNEFLSPHGLRSLSKAHEKQPFTFGEQSVGYEPAEATSRIKGGNSNWRGPVWLPTTFLMIESLRKLEKGFGGGVRVPVGEDFTVAETLDSISGTMTDAEALVGFTDDETSDQPYDDRENPMADSRVDEGVGAVATSQGALPDPAAAVDTQKSVTLTGLAANLAERVIGIFLPDVQGYRPLYGPRGTRKAELFANDPHWKNLVLFHEYFNGDTGEGLGASHQTGWTGLVASLIDEWR